ncbi:MAG: hypothetical protein WCT16_03000 [Candidatus Buchananbacteria bacterium]
MALNEQQQVFELVKKSRQTLIAFRKDWTGDALSGSLALAEFLRKLGQKVDIVCHDFKQSSNLAHLPASEIKKSLNNLQKFIVSVDLTATGLAEFQYDHKEGRLNFYITPQEGQLTPDNIATSVSGYKYDLVFLINTPDLESLGELYLRNTDFFYSVPKVNIDHAASNEYYGNINLVNIAAASSSEVVYDLINGYDAALIDDNLATYILSGIIMATKNFKTGEVTPKTLTLASELISKGARRDQIVQNLYQSRFLSTLKLWGRVLSRLNNDLNDRIVWSVLSTQDFLETATNPEELSDVIDELIVSMPRTEAVVLMYEDKRGEVPVVQVLVYAIKNHDAIFMARKFNPSGNKDVAKFVLTGTTLAEAERTVIEEVKKQLA